jgi:hypothetical protein
MDQKEYKRQYYLKNKDKFKENNNKRDKTDEVKAKRKAYYEENKSIISEKHKVYKINNPDKVILYGSRYKEVKNKKWRELYSSNPLFKVKVLTQKAIYSAFKKRNTHKSKHTEEILGCNISEFKSYLESQFEPWMNWENQGGSIIKTSNTSWDIDHIIPISSAQTVEDIIRLNHYTNLRPICSYYNRFIKRDNIE